MIEIPIKILMTIRTGTEIEVIKIETGKIVRGMEDHHLTGTIRIEIEKTIDMIEIPIEILMTIRTGTETEVIRIETGKIVREMEGHHLTGTTRTKIETEVIKIGMVKGIDVLLTKEKMM